MPNKDFLEDYSLFRKYNADLPTTLDKIPKVPINMFCKVCKSSQTFNMINDYWEFHNYMNASSANEKIRLLYLCQSCKKSERQFQIYISDDRKYCYKFGQYPEWEIKMDKGLEKTLGKHSSAFRKGLVCESQGYGIGAFAYFRRIIEEIIDELLDSITELIDPNDLTDYLSALEKTKNTRVTQEKIDLVKDLLPAILKPNGFNPLGVLHSELSEGLHTDSDELCLEKAHHVKEILSFLVNQIILSKQAANNFTSSMRALLDKKNKSKN